MKFITVLNENYAPETFNLSAIDGVHPVEEDPHSTALVFKGSTDPVIYKTPYNNVISQLVQHKVLTRPAIITCINYIEIHPPIKDIHQEEI